MTKSELISRIKRLAKVAYSQQTNKPAEPSKFPIVDKFPTIKNILNDLFDFQYEAFVSDIQWVAPRPSTFRIILVNDGKFYLMYNGTDNDKDLFTAQIEGKKYYLESLVNQQRASEALSRVLRYTKPDASEAKPEDQITPPESPASEEAPAEETPATPEEPELETPPDSPVA
jgi:hypothetical protein